MFKILLSLVAAFVTVHGAGELAILHSPDSIKFSGQEPLDESLLKEVFSASLGFTVSKGIDWPGITITDPFHYPEALVTVVIDGVAGLGLPSEIKAPRYPLNTNEDESITWQALHDRVLRRYLGQDPQLFRVDLPEQLNNVVQLFSEEESTPKNLSLRYLDPTVSEDKQFLKEMGLLLNIVKLVQFSASKQDGIKDFYWLVCRSLHAVCDLHGYDSEATKEAFQILGNTLQEVTKAFINAYTKDKVLVAAMCSDVSHTRRTRSLLQQEEPVDLNLAPEYSPEYPVIFNIMLWFGVAFVFSLLAISLFIADMDPGRDSIIYRMTSTRMKKDN